MAKECQRIICLAENVAEDQEHTCLATLCLMRPLMRTAWASTEHTACGDRHCVRTRTRDTKVHCSAGVTGASFRTRRGAPMKALRVCGAPSPTYRQKQNQHSLMVQNQTRQCTWPNVQAGTEDTQHCSSRERQRIVMNND